MNSFGSFKHWLIAVTLCRQIITLSAIPLMEEDEIQNKFLKRRSRAARKLYHAHGKLSNSHIELDPVCGLTYGKLASLCVTVAERLYPRHRLTIGAGGSWGMYKKSGARIPPETCIDGRVVVTRIKKGRPIRKTVRVKMFKCPMSNYKFEEDFEMGDFYLASSYSLKRIYVLRDYYDKSPLHVDKPGPNNVLPMFPSVYADNYFRQLEDEKNELERQTLTSTSLAEEQKPSTKKAKPSKPPKPPKNSSSEPSSTYEFNGTVNISELVKASEEKVYLTKDGKVLVRLYALVGRMNLKRINVRVHRADSIDTAGKKTSFFGRLFHAGSSKEETDENVTDNQSNIENSSSM